MQTQKKYTTVLVLTGVVCLLSLYLYRHRQGHTGKIDQAIISTTGAFQEHFFYFGHGTRTLVDHYLFLVNAKKQNEELTKELDGLRSKLSLLSDLELENTRLREALHFKSKIKSPMLSAHVIAHDASADFASIRIDKGLRDGVRVGQGVISAGGIVGKVKHATATYSDVVTLIDPTSNIDVVVQRSRARGVLSGVSKQLTCKMKYVDRLEDVTVNDAVVSTDFGGFFPKGHLVGFVTEVTPSSNGILQSVVIKPAVEVFKLEEVLVVISESESKTLPQ